MKMNKTIRKTNKVQIKFLSNSGSCPKKRARIKYLFKKKKKKKMGPCCLEFQML